jgi:ribokinase
LLSVRVTVTGSLNYDLMAYVDHLPRPGEAVHAHEVRAVLGGKGFNQAVAARRLGAAVEMVGAVGPDEFGREFEARLDELGIGRGGVRRLQARTGMAVPIVDRQGENSIVVALGANLALLPDMLDALPPADVLLVQGELRPETTAHALELGGGRCRLLNLAPASAELLAAVPLADVVIVNEVEAEDLGGPDLLRELGAGAVVVTLGARGAMVDGRVLPTPRVRAVDTTGAGDAFCGALAVALAEGRTLEDAVLWANRAGAAACLRAGTSEAMPTRAEVERLS